jgi:putative acetyltransferase
MISVRHYAASDLAAVVSLFQRSVREVACRDYSPAQIAVWAPEPPDLAAWSARLSMSDGVFVAEKYNEIVGFARITDEGYIDLLFVDPAFQGQGVAHSLCDRTILWVSGRDVSRLTAEVSITAKSFFERVGFRVVRAQEVERQGVRLRNFFMERNIDGEPIIPPDAAG